MFVELVLLAAKGACFMGFLGAGYFTFEWARFYAGEIMDKIKKG